MSAKASIEHVSLASLGYDLKEVYTQKKHSAFWVPSYLLCHNLWDTHGQPVPTSVICTYICYLHYLHYLHLHIMSSLRMKESLRSNLM